VARGGGALLAAIGGIVLLGDHLSPVAVIAILLIATGLIALAGRAMGPELSAALVVAATIGVYSVSDAQGIRSTGTPVYVLASFVGTMISTTIFGLWSGRRTAMVAAMRSDWRRFATIGMAVVVTYGMVQLAFQRAPVGYVTALRESSVLLAALAGWRMLDESAGARRIVSSTIVVGGHVLLVVAR
jgi:drug/metabolite transporter (DMT)-like permease